MPALYQAVHVRNTHCDYSKAIRSTWFMSRQLECTQYLFLTKTVFLSLIRSNPLNIWVFLIMVIQFGQASREKSVNATTDKIFFTLFSEIPKLIHPSWNNTLLYPHKPRSLQKKLHFEKAELLVMSLIVSVFLCSLRYTDKELRFAGIN